MPAYTPGVNHGHTPSGRWADVQKNPNSSFVLNRLCPRTTPKELVDLAIWKEFDNKPIARAHLDWYISKGKGLDFVEDANIKLMLEKDTKVQALLARFIGARTAGMFAFHFKLEQSDYENQDLRFAFGAVDRVDVEVDFAANTLHAWFMDRYEWHPVYAGLYTAFPDDIARETNCVHAALVELQSSGAADFWMKGEATVPLSMIAKPPAAKSTSGTPEGGGSTWF